MTTMTATFDGRALILDEPVDLAPNSRVRVTIEATIQPSDQAIHSSFLSTAQRLEIEGPEDWSERLEEYLYSRDSERP